MAAADPPPDKHASSEFLADILDLEVEPPWGPFLPLKVGAESLDFEDADEVGSMHLAFLVGEAEFDAARDRLRAAQAATYADPFRSKPGEINHLYGGRGMYFDGPEGHYYELITAPYGPVSEVDPPSRR